MTEPRFYVEPRIRGGLVYDRERTDGFPVAHCLLLADAIRIAALLNGTVALTDVLDPAS